MHGTVAGRVETLDLIRGIAVLGILAINIAGFAGPPAAVLTPGIPVHAEQADKLAYAATFLLFEGKMRGLFSLLFGASLALFVERNDAAGRHGDLLQLRRLGWLILFGALHYYLLWWGDILFAYGTIGIVALMMRDINRPMLVKIALSVFVIWHLGEMAFSLPELIADEAVRNGSASAQAARAHFEYLASVDAEAERELAAISDSWWHEVVTKMQDDPFRPFTGLIDALGETLPLMLLGMVFYESGFFTGDWGKGNVRRLALGGTVVGLALTAILLAWVWPRDFPVRTMSPLLITWTGIPHLLMTLGFAALLVLAGPAIGSTLIGGALRKAGRMAFSNYIGTSLLMTWLFHGWGFGLAGTYGYAALMVFVALGWAAMLALSVLWLAHFRRGPLEWLWRSLVERRVLPNLR